MSQTAKDIQRSHETLVDIFERLEGFFQRLEIYTEVAPTTKMTDTIIQITVEVLTILGIATRRLNKAKSVRVIIMKLSPLTKQCS